MKRLLSFLFVTVIFIASVSAQTIYYPPSGQIVDQAGVLSPSAKQKIKQLLATDKENQIAIAILKDLKGQSGREYGIELARRWQLGKKDKDNGVLILISLKERYAGIEVGYGLEGILPDSLIGRILREKIIPPLQKNDYEKASLDGVVAIMSVISNPDARKNDASEEDLSTLLIFLILFLLFLNRNRGGGTGLFLPRGGFKGGFKGGFRGGGGRFGGGGAGGRF